jgi:hypothetical protein
LFGQAYGRGLAGGSTGGGADDVRSYYDACATKQKNDIAPRLGMLDQVLVRSATGGFNDNIAYEWNPLWQLSDADKATIQFQKAQATQIYANLGIINEDALREGIVNQLIEDQVYAGFEAAVEKYGAEPEEPEEDPMQELNQQMMKAKIANMGGGEASPNPEETGHTGQTAA